MKKILVIGGHGFMGKNIQKEFENSDYKMYYLSRKDDLDMFNEETVDYYFNEIKPDIIVFAAAHVGSINYVTNNAASVANDNTQMYLNLYKGLVRAELFNTIIINPISNCSYAGYIDIQDENLWWEGEIHESVEAYGMPKKMGFILSKAYDRQYGIKTLNLILPNAYGENDHLDEEKTHAMNGIVMRMIKSIKNGDKYFDVWGTGKPVREWLYMSDFARLLKEIIDNENYDLPNPINIGKEYGISILDTVKNVAKLLEFNGEIKFNTSKQDGAPIKVLGKKLFKEHFPNFKFTDYEEGINNTIKYYKEKLK